MNEIFGMKEALNELGLETINDGSSTGKNCFSSGEIFRVVLSC